jgi:TRAP-type C4-dicarboxylate transport system permease large subunit
MPSSRPDPRSYNTGWSYFWAKHAWKREHGGSMIGNVAVAAIAGGITGSQAAVVVFIALAVLVTLARRRSEPPEAGQAAGREGVGPR